MFDWSYRSSFPTVTYGCSNSSLKADLLPGRVIRVAATLVAFKGITKAEFKSLFDRSKDLSA